MAEEMTTESWGELPAFVVLNPLKDAMFNDEDKSGMYLAQWDGTDRLGNDIRNYGPVPKQKDCSRIKMALDVGLLFQCNPKGQCRHLPEPLIAENTIEDLMVRNSRELTALLPHINDARLLSEMKEYEEGKPKKEIRRPFLRDLHVRQNEVNGLSAIKSAQAMIADKDGKMVPDSINVTR